MNSPSENRGVALYLDLMKRCVCGWIYEDAAEPLADLLNSETRAALAGGTRAAQPVPFHSHRRLTGTDWPSRAHTMIGLRRLDNLQQCVEDVLKNQVPGDLIETGVWRGGAAIFMRAIVKAYGDTARVVWAADTFAGLPPPNPRKYPQDADSELYQVPYLAVSLEQVRDNFRKYALLDEQVRFLKGLFSETLPTAPIERLAVIRLDGDMYESTMDALVHLYPKLSVGGYLLIDDFSVPACRQALEDYRGRHGIAEPIQAVDWTGAFWQRAR